MATRPPPAGPRNLREMFHYTWTWLNTLSARIDAGGGGGGGHIIAEGGSALPAQPTLNFDGTHFDLVNNGGATRTDVDLSAAVIASLALADTGLQNVVEDPTPELGGDLDALRRRIANVESMSITGQSAPYTVTPPAFLDMSDNHTWDGAALFPEAFVFAGTHTIKQSFIDNSALFVNGPVLKNDPAVSGIIVPALLGLYSVPTYQADTVAAVGSFSFDFFGVPIFDAINGGTLDASAGGAATLFSGLTVNAGVTVGARPSVRISDATGAGVLSNQAGIVIDSLIKGGNNTAILLGGGFYPPGNFNIYQGGFSELPNVWNGRQRYKQRTLTTSRTLDITDHEVFCNNTAAIIVTLDTAVGYAGAEQLIIKGNVGAVDIVMTGSETLNGVGGTARVLATLYEWIKVKSNGVNWVIVGWGVSPPANTFSAEMILNGDFAAGAANWTPSAGTWVIAAGICTVTAGANNSNITQTTGIFLAGHSYRVTYTVSGYTAGTVRFRFTGASNTNGTTRTANGTYVEDVTLTANATDFNIRASAAGTTCIIDNVSVKEILT